MKETRVGDFMLQIAIAGQQQQALTIGIQAAGRIDAGNSDKLGQRALTGLPGELTEHLEWFMEEQVTVEQRIRFQPETETARRAV
jgi:hypothetical protein